MLPLSSTIQSDFESSIPRVCEVQHTDLVRIPFANHNLPRSEEEINLMVESATKAYGEFMDALGFDWRGDPNSMDTPRRVSNAFIREYARGCYSQTPKITAFKNTNQYDGIVAQTNIKVNSLCSHHHAPFTGLAHIAYIPSKEGKIIGLSKLNRIVEWFSLRPQVQESLTVQIAEYVDKVCEDNKGVAVLIEANHTCCSNRGPRQNSTMRTAKFLGEFQDNFYQRNEFYQLVKPHSRL